MPPQAINPPPPASPPLSWRAISGADLDAIVALAVACQRVDGGLAFLNAPAYLQERYLPIAPGAAIGAFDDQQRLIACTTVHRTAANDGELVRIVGQVLPAWRHQGIGDYLLRWSLAQAHHLLKELATDHPQIQIATESLTDPADRLYRAHGFAPVMSELVMQRRLTLPLPAAEPPPGVTLTGWQPSLADQYFQAYDRSFRTRPGFPGWSAQDWLSWTTGDDSFRPDWTLLAQAGDEPVGFLTAEAEHPGGFIVQVGVVPQQRRRGLASALLVASMRRMQAAGATAVQLTVNFNNPGAIRTYLALDFATVGRRARYELKP